MPLQFQVVDKFNDEVMKSVFSFKKVVTDTTIFRLHYKFSLWLVIIYSLFHIYVSCNSVTVSCIASGNDNKGLSKHMNAIEDYCWSEGTYSVRKAKTSDKQLYPGIEQGGPDPDDEHVVYHHYYKWMYVIIFIKIVFLYAPHHVWRNIENGLMKTLTEKVHRVLFIDGEETTKELDKLGDYFHLNLGNHSRYAYGLVFCEALNVVVVSSLLFVWDFLTGHELSLHASVSTWIMLNTPSALRDDPLIEIFPILGKCTFKQYGPSGSFQSHDFLCVLPVNVINERAAVFFWYYFMMLIAVGSVQLIFRAMLIMSKRLRATLLQSASPITLPEEIALINAYSSYADWFILNQFGLNVEPIVFRKVLQKLVEKLRMKEECGSMLS